MKLWRVALVLGLAILAAALVLLASPAKLHAQNKPSKKSAGFVISDDASTEDVGLPIYPGARKLKPKSKDGESPALQMGLWGGSSGFKLVLLKLESDDAPAKIADFYRQALAKYGSVIDCSKPGAKPEKSAGAGAPDCDSDEPGAGGLLFKSGSKEKQHIVAVESEGKHSKIALIFLQAPPDSKQD